MTGFIYNQDIFPTVPLPHSETSFYHAKPGVYIDTDTHTNVYLGTQLLTSQRASSKYDKPIYLSSSSVSRITPNYRYDLNGIYIKPTVSFIDGEETYAPEIGYQWYQNY